MLTVRLFQATGLKRIKSLFQPPFVILLVAVTQTVLAQPETMRDGGMMDNGMMMSGWAILFCVVLGVLILVALILSIVALIKYIFGNRR